MIYQLILKYRKEIGMNCKCRVSVTLATVGFYSQPRGCIIVDLFVSLGTRENMIYMYCSSLYRGDILPNSRNQKWESFQIH